MTKNKNGRVGTLRETFKTKILPTIALVMLANIICFLVNIFTFSIDNVVINLGYIFIRCALFIFLGTYLSRRATPPELCEKRSLSESLSSFFMPAFTIFLIAILVYFNDHDRRSLRDILMTSLWTFFHGGFHSYSLDTPVLLFISESFLIELSTYTYLLAILAYNWRQSRWRVANT